MNTQETTPINITREWRLNVLANKLMCSCETKEAYKHLKLGNIDTFISCAYINNKRIAYTTQKKQHSNIYIHLN